MKYVISIVLILMNHILLAQNSNGYELLELIDENLNSETKIVTSKMIIRGRRASRTIESKSWIEGEEKSFTEYLSPPREQGTKMLKIEDNLWMYSPSTDRIITISGHMLRQSIMGSDLSYEDMMEDSRLENHYDPVVSGTDTLNGTECWVMELTAITTDVAYHFRKMWIDKEKYVPLKEELYAKGGKLLKKTEVTEVKMVEGRWYPFKMVFKDMLKRGKGTEFIIESITFNKEIPEYLFSKAALKR
ncbi:MAG: outer membrane lipoprotein-sorting protein [bacterium]